MSFQVLAKKRSDSEMRNLAIKMLKKHKTRAGKHDDLREFLSLSKLKVFGYNDGGFVVLTSDDEFKDVIGYSSETFLDSMPCGFKWWMNTVNDNMSKGKSAPFFKNRTRGMTSVGPFIKTKWGQERPFNDKCTVTVKGGKRIVPTGCNATAMAQIMNYYNYPTKGKGEKSYEMEYSDWGTITYSANFENSYYDWANMLNDYSEYYKTTKEDPHTKAVSQLMFDCGIAVETRYTTSNSTAYSSKAATSLVKYFMYDSEQTKYHLSSDYSGVEWLQMIYDELDNGRPIIYTGADNKGENGHAFIIHGYDSQGNFCINWGWYGSYDGYFNIDLLMPSRRDYSYYQEMIVVVPEKTSAIKKKHNLCISANGNGKICYNNISGNQVREEQQCFEIKDGGDATLYFYPDDGYILKKAFINNEDITSKIDNRRLSIQNIRSFTIITAYFEEKGKSDKHDYVNLGLPSGVLWATNNIGADRPEASGDYFAWAETSTKDEYNWNTYKYAKGTEKTLTKYCNNVIYGDLDNKEVLEEEDDAATVIWGKPWRTPTLAEVQELVKYCTWKFEKRNFESGYSVTGPNGNSIFFPAAGVRQNTYRYYDKSGACVQSATIFNSKNGKPSSASVLYAENGKAYSWYGWSRCWGYPVRPVKSSPPNGVINPFVDGDIIIGIYDIFGHKLDYYKNGINIIKYKDGRTRKIIR